MKPIGIKNKRNRILIGIILGLAVGSGVAIVFQNPLLGIALAFVLALTFILPVFVPSKQRSDQENSHDI